MQSYNIDLTQDDLTRDNLFEREDQTLQNEFIEQGLNPTGTAITNLENHALSFLEFVGLDNQFYYYRHQSDVYQFTSPLTPNDLSTPYNNLKDTLAPNKLVFLNGNAAYPYRSVLSKEKNLKEIAIAFSVPFDNAKRIVIQGEKNRTLKSIQQKSILQKSIPQESIPQKSIQQESNQQKSNQKKRFLEESVAPSMITPPPSKRQRTEVFEHFVSLGDLDYYVYSNCFIYELPNSLGNPNEKINSGEISLEELEKYKLVYKNENKIHHAKGTPYVYNGILNVPKNFMQLKRCLSLSSQDEFYICTKAKQLNLQTRPLSLFGGRKAGSGSSNTYDNTNYNNTNYKRTT